MYSSPNFNFVDGLGRFAVELRVSPTSTRLQNEVSPNPKLSAAIESPTQCRYQASSGLYPPLKPFTQHDSNGFLSKPSSGGLPVVESNLSADGPHNVVSPQLGEDSCPKTFTTDFRHKPSTGSPLSSAQMFSGNMLATSKSIIDARREYIDQISLPTPIIQLEKRKGRGGVIVTFPEQLHRLLEESEQCNFADIISWQPHGRAFRVHNKELFVSQVMMKYFKTCLISSFQKQLNVYGFICLKSSGADKKAYFHPMFIRGLPILCLRMRRLRPGKDKRVYLPPELEPDFYRLPPAPATGTFAASQININSVALVASTTTSTYQLGKHTLAISEGRCSIAKKPAAEANITLKMDDKDKEGESLQDSDPLLQFFLEERQRSEGQSLPCAADLVSEMDF